jgi:hypothetical protein
MHIIYLKQDIYKKINSKWSWSQGYDDFYDKIDNAMLYIWGNFNGYLYMLLISSLSSTKSDQINVCV